MNWKILTVATYKEINKPTTNDSESTILAEQVLHSYSAINTANIATFINAPILIFILWSVIEHDVLIIWLTLIVIVTLSRAIAAYQYKMAKPHPENVNLWMRRYLVDVLLTSLVWAASAILLFPIDDISHQVFLAFVIGGMAAGAVTALSYIKLAIYSFLGLSLIPLLIMFFYTGTELGNAMGFMVALYLVMLVLAANRNHAIIKQNICMKINSLEREQILQTKAEQLESVIKNAPIVLWSLDKNGIFTLSEGCALKELGLKPGQVVGESVFDVYAEYPEIINAAKRVLSGESFDTEMEVNDRTYICHYTPYYSEQNEISRCNGVAIDITERKKVEVALIDAKDEAENASLAKTQFLSCMSHELRTPLNAIIGFSQLLEMDEVNKTKRENIHEIIVGGKHLLDLINEVLELAKIESGNVDLSIGNYSLHKILKDSLSMIKPFADKHAIQINDKVSSLPDINISVDNLRFKQVLLNLLSNAIKYNNEKGKVTIDYSSNDNNMLSLSITDTGKGFTAQQLNHLFEPFERFGAQNSHIEGTGLGLVIAKDLIEKMGGKISVESEYGKGSRFIIYTPLP